jgi:hypothetical protein
VRPEVRTSRRDRARRATAVLAAIILAAGAVSPVGQRAAAVEETSALDALLPTTGRVAPKVAPAGATPALASPPTAISTVPVSPGGWARFVNRPLIRQVRGVVAWIGSLLRFLWSIPKAIFQGDSRGMIDALGDLLSKSSPDRRPAGGSSAGARDGAGEDRGAPANLSLQ